MHPATIMAMAREACRTPLGGEDSFGDLSWRIGPHHLGLPWLRVEMTFDNEQSEFSTQYPLTPEQVDLDFHADRDGDKPNGAVADYLDEQLDEDDRKDVLGYLCEDAEESVRCQQGALRIEQCPELQNLLVDAITNNNRRGMDDALDLGAQINQADELGNTPLHLAAQAGHHRLILPLIHAGATVDAVNSIGQSPLHLAAAQACAHGCLVLLAHNADPKRKDYRGRSPLPQPHWGYGNEPSL